MRRTIALALISCSLFSASVAFALTDDTPTSGSAGGDSIHCPQLTSTFKKGDRDTTANAQVSDVQAFLAEYFDLPDGTVSGGYFGKTTERYVIRFQKEQGVPSFGIVGSLTRQAIAKACSKTSLRSTITDTSRVNLSSAVQLMTAGASKKCTENQASQNPTIMYIGGNRIALLLADGDVTHQILADGMLYLWTDTGAGVKMIFAPELAARYIYRTFTCSDGTTDAAVFVPPSSITFPDVSKTQIPTIITSEGRDTRRIIGMMTLQGALRAYHNTHGSYPATLSSDLFTASKTTQPLPLDPLYQIPYLYAALGAGSSCTSYHIGIRLETAYSSNLTGKDLDASPSTVCSGSGPDFSGIDPIYDPAPLQEQASIKVLEVAPRAVAFAYDNVPRNSQLVFVAADTGKRFDAQSKILDNNGADYETINLLADMPAGKYFLRIQDYDSLKVLAESNVVYIAGANPTTVPVGEYSDSSSKTSILPVGVIQPTATTGSRPLSTVTVKLLSQDSNETYVAGSGRALMIAWYFLGTPPVGSRVCTTLVSQDTAKNFAFPSDHGCVDASTKPSALTGYLVRTPGYDLGPGKYKTKVVLIGPTTSDGKDGGTLSESVSTGIITLTSETASVSGGESQLATALVALKSALESLLAKMQQ